MTIAGSMAILAWAGVAIGLWRKHPWVAFGMLWPVIALVPAHSVIAKVDAVSESSLYLAWVGPSIALAMASRRLLTCDRHRMAVGFVVILLAATCIWRTVIWGNPVLLWHEAVARAPMSSRAWNNLGLAYMGKAHSKEAKHAFETALKLDPGNARAIRNLDLLELVN